MSALLLTLTVLISGVQGIFTKKYSRIDGCGMYTYYFISSMFALALFIFQSGFNLEFQYVGLIYSFLFAVAYCSAIVFQFVALKNGPLSLTILIVSYSLIIPAFYGIFFLKERFSALMIVGLVFLAISLVMTVEFKQENKKINLRWFIAVSMAFVGNGMCSTVQKMHQVRFNGHYKSELMIFALIIVALFMLTMGLTTERKIFLNSVRRGWYLSASLGIANGLTNLFVLILNNIVPASLLFPVVSAGGVVSSSIVGIVIFKERLNRIQLVGVIIGIIAIVLLNV